LHFFLCGDSFRGMPIRALSSFFSELCLVVRDFAVSIVDDINAQSWS
jgi:hypothetical protein